MDHTDVQIPQEIKQSRPKSHRFKRGHIVTLQKAIATPEGDTLPAGSFGSVEKVLADQDQVPQVEVYFVGTFQREYGTIRLCAKELSNAIMPDDPPVANSLVH